ncbi:MAG: hypothetical protein ABJN69_09325 [Hellea sp.]
MSWKKIGPVQHVSALLCQGMDMSPILQRLQSGPKAYQDIELAQGGNWHVIFGKAFNSEEILLPHIGGAIPLFKAFPDIWMNVGTEFDLSPRAQKDYIEKIRLDHELSAPEIVIIPQFSDEAAQTLAADIFAIEQKVPVSQLSLPSLS